MKRIIIIGTAISFLIASCAPEVKEDSAPTLVKGVGVEEIKTTDFEHWVELQGALESDNDVMLTPQTAGTISRIYVQEGQKVQRGQLIAYMDSDVISKNVDEVQTALNNAEYVYEKQLALFKKGVGTEFDTTQAYNQVQSLRRKISTLQTQAGKSAVVAPFTGYIDEIYPSEGEVGGPQSPICHLVGLHAMHASAAISESYFHDIKAGSEVRVEISALDTLIDSLTISRVSNYINPNNRTYQIHIDLKNKKELFVPNLVAKIYVRDKALKSVQVVKSESVQYDKDGNPYIYYLTTDTEDSKKEKKPKKSDGKKEDIHQKEQKYKAHKVMIERLSSYGGKTAIHAKTDIPNGAKIVTIGAEGIQDGESVVIAH